MGTRIGIAMLFAAATTLAAEVEIKGKVVDAEGKPVAGVEVATFWDSGPQGMAGVRGATTDAAGAFSLTAENYGRTLALLALGKDRKLGATSFVRADATGEEQELRLEPTVTLSGRFTCSDLQAAPPWTMVYVMLDPGGIRVAQCSSMAADFSFVLPSGDYKFHMYGTDVQGRGDERFVEGTEGAIDFGAIDLRATTIAKLYGKPPPPWKVTDARGVGKDATPAKFKGKWLLLEFWGFW